MPRPEELFQQALQLHRAGQFAQAEPVYRQILRDHPQHADALQLLGVLEHQTGRSAEALEHLEKAIKLLPNNAVVLNNIGAAYRALQRWPEARGAYERACQAKPDYAEAFVNLGGVLSALGDWPAAEEAAAQGVRWNPGLVEGQAILGTAQYVQGKHAAARTAFEAAIHLDPQRASFHNDLGAVYLALRLFTEARSSFERALRLDPKLAAAHINLGNVYKECEQFADAERCYRKAIVLQPDLSTAHANLGNVLREQGKMQGAVEELECSVQLDSRAANTWNNLALAYMIQGRHREAAQAYERVAELAPSDGLRIRQALLLPVVLESAEHLKEVRESFVSRLDALCQGPLQIHDPLIDAGVTVFHLAYHGGNDRALYEQLARMYLRACPSLAYVAPHCQPGAWTPPVDRPVRVGFLSKYFYNHSVGRHYAGVIRNFSRDGFHVTVLKYPGHHDEMARQIQEAADTVVTIPLHLPHAREIVAQQQLDVLFFPDIGMTPYAYHLAFSRLAPVQCVTNGHPVTTGLPEMDYFISCQDIEPPDAAEHYSERLVLMRNIPNFFERPALLGEPRKRADYGLSDDRHLYLCPQNLCKVHPDFDALAAEILERDPLGEVVFFHGTERTWGDILWARLQKTIPHVCDRIRILDAQPYHLFLHLLRLADAVLDTTHFGGGTTTAQALGVGAPVVTLPASGMRGRITLGNYRQMGLLDLVAADREEYVRLAVRLGTEPEFRHRMREEILARNDVLFNNPGFVRELEDFFRRAVQEAGQSHRFAA